MKNLFILSALISLTFFFACNQEIEDDFVPASQEVSFSPITTGEANFTINTENDIFENDVLLLTNNSINAVSYLWDFGNGDTSTEAYPTYKYDMHGSHTVKLAVTDANGEIHEASHEIVVLCIFGGGTHESND